MTGGRNVGMTKKKDTQDDRGTRLRLWGPSASLHFAQDDREEEMSERQESSKSLGKMV
jgi:hypothetical protein